MSSKHLFIFLCLFFLSASAVKAAGPGDVIISEIKIGDTGASTNEFIELYNRTDADIILDGFTLKKKTKGGTESNLISSAKFIGTIRAHGFFLIAHPDYKNAVNADLAYSGSSYSIAADNTVILYDTNDAVIDKVGYGEASDFFGGAAPSPDNGQSIMRKISGGMMADTHNNAADFFVANPPSPQNSQSPAGALTDTAEMQSNINATSATDNPASNNNTRDTSSSAPSPSSASSGTETSPYDYSNDIIISEIFPNPLPGDAKGEFVELYNKGEKDLRLAGWRIGDESGRQYQIPTTTGEYPKIANIIKAKDFFVVYRQESNIALDNDGDSVKLYKPLKVTATETVKYKNAPAGWSYSRDAADNRWMWVEDVTPDRENTVPLPNDAPLLSFDFPSEASSGVPVIFDASDTTDNDNDKISFTWNFGDSATSSLETSEHTFWKAGTYTVSLTASDGKDESVKSKKIKIAGGKEKIIQAGAVKPAKAATGKKTKAKTSRSARPSSVRIASVGTGDTLLPVGAFKTMSGTVAVLPGVFGSQYFYILGTRGIQVYNYKKDFPALAVGDSVEVSGEISDNNGEPRLKTKIAGDMKILSQGKEPEAVLSDCADIGNDAAGELVKISGTITDKKGQTVYVDDNTAEAAVYIKKGTNISMAVFVEGENVSITGLVIPVKGAFQIWPRSVDDVKLEKAGEVLGTTTASDVWTLAARDKKMELLYYILIILGGLVAVLGGLMIKAKFFK